MLNRSIDRRTPSHLGGSVCSIDNHIDLRNDYWWVKTLLKVSEMYKATFWWSSNSASKAQGVIINWISQHLISCWVCWAIIRVGATRENSRKFPRRGRPAELLAAILACMHLPWSSVLVWLTCGSCPEADIFRIFHGRPEKYLSVTFSIRWVAEVVYHCYRLCWVPSSLVEGKYTMRISLDKGEEMEESVCFAPLKLITTLLYKIVDVFNIIHKLDFRFCKQLFKLRSASWRSSEDASDTASSSDWCCWWVYCVNDELTCSIRAEGKLCRKCWSRPNNFSSQKPSSVS